MSLSALKAAFYGSHLKRQRVACCLLALRFGRRDGPLEEIQSARYWLQVRGVLEALRDDCKSDREAIEAIEIVQPLVKPKTPRQWTPTLGSPVDFAPRMSDEELMLRHMHEMETLLAATATTLGSVTLDASALSQWSELRSDLSNLVREWERGKDVLERIVGVPELPPFMKAWSESPQQPSTPVMSPAAPTTPTVLSSPARSDDDVGDHLISSASPNSLPPPGIDTVFEGFSSRSRPQRIKLAPVAANHNGQVVDELRDVIGLIRKKKGVADEETVPTQPIEQSDRSWRPTQHPFVGLGLPPPPRRSDAEAGLLGA